MKSPTHLLPFILIACLVALGACRPSSADPDDTPSTESPSAESPPAESPSTDSPGQQTTAQGDYDPLTAPEDVAAPPADAETTASGLASRVLRAGTGTEHPGPTTRVTVNYSGWTTDGNMFDSSFARGEPATFGLNQVIAGWTEGLQLMVVGELRRFWIPEALAYGGRPGRPAGMLVFDVELLSF